MPNSNRANTLAVRILKNLLNYQEALSMQSAIEEARKNGFCMDTLLLLQHHHCITVGKRAEDGLSNVKTNLRELTRLGIQVCRTDRGGDVTYHGPGQFVCYPIIDLRRRKIGARKYVEGLERAMIEVARKHGIMDAEGGKRDKNGRDMSGVWVGERKLGAVGVKISGGVTSHGFALNAYTDLGFFREHVVPCGLEGKDVTSLEDLCRENSNYDSAAKMDGGFSEKINRERVEIEIVDAFAKLFDYDEVFTRRIG